MNSSELVQIDYSLFENSFQLDLSVYDEDFLLKVLFSRMVVAGCVDTVQYHNYLWKHPEEMKLFKSHLNNSFSEFFREAFSLSLLKNQVLPMLVKQEDRSKTFRIWSAGCALGQEAYSLAMLFDDGLKNTGHTYRILATDINPENLNAAKIASYSEESLQRVPYGWWKKYFETVPLSSSARNPRSLVVEYRVIESLRERVDFALFDLNDRRFTSPPDAIFGDFDLIMCSNLLFYYNSDARSAIAKKLIKSLAKGGILITGESEREIFLRQKNLVSFDFPASIFKNETRT